MRTEKIDPFVWLNEEPYDIIEPTKFIEDWIYWLIGLAYQLLIINYQIIELIFQKHIVGPVLGYFRMFSNSLLGLFPTVYFEMFLTRLLETFPNENLGLFQTRKLGWDY